MRQIICDTETTGLNPQTERLISVAAIEMIDGELTGAFAHWHLNPGKPSHPKALEVHGLTDEYLATQPEFYDVGQSLLTFLGGSPLIFHNAPFDTGFLEAEYDRAYGDGIWLTNPVRCTYAKAVAARGMGKGRNTLDALTKAYNTLDIRAITGGKHGALIDCIQLYGVYRALHGESQVPLLQSLLDHYSKGFGIYGSLAPQGPGSPTISTSARFDPTGISADIRSVG